MAVYKTTIYLFIIAAIIIIRRASSTRVLLDDAILVSPPGVSFPSATPFSNIATGTTTTSPTGTEDVADDTAEDVADTPLPDTDANTTPDDGVAPVADVAPVTSPAVEEGADVEPVVASKGQAQLSFFMHDIIGGSHPSARVVTGVITSTNLNAVPFSKPANNIFPLTGGVPLLTGNGANLNGVINNNNLPSLTGLNPGGIQASTIIQNNGNNNQVTGGNNHPFVTAGQLPAGATIQNLMFGTITVVDDELTEGHELGSSVLGKAQGFYLASSLDGTSQTMAITLMFHHGTTNKEEIVDTISLFGVHRTASTESQVAIVGGTGKYEHAKGYATVVTLPQVDQHTTDGVDTILEFNVYFLD